MATASNVYGSDLDITTPGFSLISGPEYVVQCLVFRLQTSFLFYDPSYGYPVGLNLINSATGGDASAISNAIEAEALKDDRIVACTASVSLSDTTLTINISIELSQGETFDLVGSLSTLSASQLTFTSTRTG